jgi:Tfp pilus assembly protein PilO
MTKLTKTQRDQLLGVAMGAVAVMGALWYFVVMAQQRELDTIKKNTNKITDTLKNGELKIRSGAQIGLQLTNEVEILQKREAELAPGHDPYSWMIAKIGQFILPRKGVNIRSISQAEISEKNIFRNFPYKWAIFHIKGVGYYREFGKFFADFENTFPYYRIQNVEISSAGVGEDYEKLSYSFDIVTPLVPTGLETK